MQEYRLRLKRPTSVFCNSFIFSKLWICDLEITQIYRTFLVNPGAQWIDEGKLLGLETNNF
jgi:hypothetical protein